MRFDDQRRLFRVRLAKNAQRTSHPAGVAARTFGAVHVQSHKELLSLVSMDSKYINFTQTSPSLLKSGKLGQSGLELPGNINAVF